MQRSWHEVVKEVEPRSVGVLVKLWFWGIANIEEENRIKIREQIERHSGSNQMVPIGHM